MPELAKNMPKKLVQSLKNQLVTHLTHFQPRSIKSMQKHAKIILKSLNLPLPKKPNNP